MTKVYFVWYTFDDDPSDIHECYYKAMFDNKEAAIQYLKKKYKEAEEYIATELENWERTDWKYRPNIELKWNANGDSFEMIDCGDSTEYSITEQDVYSEVPEES